jgi:hypothetical protein
VLDPITTNTCIASCPVEYIRNGSNCEHCGANGEMVCSNTGTGNNPINFTTCTLLNNYNPNTMLCEACGRDNQPMCDNNAPSYTGNQL